MTDSEWKAEALAFLKKIEYRQHDSFYRWCMCCGKTAKEGHQEGCELGTLIREAEGK